MKATELIFHYKPYGLLNNEQRWKDLSCFCVDIFLFFIACKLSELQEKAERVCEAYQEVKAAGTHTRYVPAQYQK